MTDKIYVIGLPRTGTTSLCLLFLELGYKVAHTAFEPNVLDKADVMADTPIFLDYPSLYARFPNSKFIYLHRDMSLWVPSIQRLLRSMRKKALNNANAFHPEINRCFDAVFPAFKTMARHEGSYLRSCYLEHYQLAKQFFSRRGNWLEIDVSASDSIDKLMRFVASDSKFDNKLNMPHVNRGRRISYWDEVVHPNKVLSL